MPNIVRDPEFREASDNTFPTRRNLIFTAAAIIIVSIIAYWPTWYLVGERWIFDTTSYSHGFLIAGVSLYLIWRAIGRFTYPTKEGNKWSAGVVILASTIWVLAYFANVITVQAALLPIILYGAFSFVFGARSATVFLVPIAILYFALPLWGILTGILQTVTIFVVGGFLAGIGITVVIEGEFVYLPSGTFQITSGCAGLHYFVVSFAIGTIFAYVFLNTLRLRGAFVGLVMFAALLTNWLRVASIIVIGHLTEMQHYLVAVDHYVYGWFLYAVMVLAVVWVGRRLENRCPASQDVAKSPNQRGGLNLTWHGSKRLLATAIIVSIVPLVAYAVERLPEQKEVTIGQLPSSLGAWSRVAAQPSRWTPYFPGNEAQLSATYSQDDIEIDIYVNLYTRQLQGQELVNDQNYLLDPKLFREIQRSVHRIELTGGEILTAAVLEGLNRHGVRSVVFYWYQIGDKRVLNPIRVKWAELLLRLVGRPRSGVVAVMTRCHDDCLLEKRMVDQILARYADNVSIDMIDVRP